MSGDFKPSRIWLRMSLVRETEHKEKASMFHDRRESVCATWLCAFLEGMGTHVQEERLKAERVHKSLLATKACGCL
jgi:hypothetical protein